MHCAVDCELYTPIRDGERPPNAPLRILSIGRLEWEKGYEWALEAIALVRAAGVPLVYRIVGTGPEGAAIRRVANQLGLQDIVFFLGERATDDVIAEYRTSDVLLHAALEDACPVVVLEAQAMEMPVVATDTGGLPEIVDHGVTGFVVPRRDPEALAQMLILLARDHARRRAMGKAARGRMLDLVDFETQVPRIAEMYAQLASVTSEPPANGTSS